MLTEFCLDNSFFESDALKSKGANRSFIEKWKEQGVLVFSNSQTETSFLEKLKKKIDPSVYQDWQDAFLENTTFRSNVDWDIFCDYTDFNDLKNFNTEFKTGITEETTEQLVKGLPNYVGCCPSTNFEIVDIDNHHSSVNMRRSYYESKSDITRDISHVEMWEIKFHSLAKYSKNILIIDRYIFENIREDIGRNKKTSVERLFEFLSQYSKKFNITIISIGGQSGSDEKFAIDKFFEEVCISKFSHCFNKIDLISKGEHFFQKISHDRFMSFDKFVCTIGIGMSIFRDYPIPQTTFNVCREEYSSINERLRLALKSCDWKSEYLPE